MGVEKALGTGPIASDSAASAVFPSA